MIPKKNFLLSTIIILISISLLNTVMTQDFDIKDMARVEGGWFEYGSNDGYKDEQPVHLIYISTFYIDKYEVSNHQYKEFCTSTNRELPKLPDEYKDYFEKFKNYPVVYVSWNDANAYCSWKNKRLPTEAEWVYAASSKSSNVYSWGKSWKSSISNNRKLDNKTIKEKRYYFQNKLGPLPVKSFIPNQVGIYNMTGNVWEWVGDWYNAEYIVYCPEMNPAGPDNGITKVIKGGSWNDESFLSRISFRGDEKPDKSFANVGFRCLIGHEQLN